MIRKDEADSKYLMEDNWLNPLSPGEPDLPNIPTGTLAPPGVVKDILPKAFNVREEAYQTSKRTRLDDTPPPV